MAKNINPEIDDQYKDAIDNYGSQIKTLKDFVTAVKKRPSYHAGGLGNRGFISLQREIFQNSVDQIVMETSPATMVSFYYNEQTLETTVFDNGLGLPFSEMERILTTPNTSKNYEKKKFNFGSGMNGVGSKIVNCLSSKFIAESYKYDGTAARFITKEGYPVEEKGKPNPFPIPNKEKKQGTKITFFPNTDVLGPINLPWQEIYTLINKIIARSVIGAVCEFEAVDKQGVSHKETIVNKDGIISDLIEMSKQPICKPIQIFDCDGWLRLNAVFVFDGQPNPGGIVREISFCNMCPTIAGTHIDGTIDGISRWFVKYMNTIYLGASTKGKSKSLKITPADIKTFIIVSIAADAVEPVFVGQAKEQLANEEMAPFCRDAVFKSLDTWSKENPAELTKLCKFIKEMAEARSREDQKRETIVNKFQSNAITGYPAKFARPIKEKKEFIIVEGDSAAGSAKEGRDRNGQGKIYAPYYSNIVCVSF